MAKLYIIESATEPRSIQTLNGTIKRQTLILREIDGISSYTQRWAVDYLGSGDLRALQGHVVATHLTTRFSHSEKGDFCNLQCREVISIMQVESSK